MAYNCTDLDLALLNFRLNCEIVGLSRLWAQGNYSPCSPLLGALIHVNTKNFQLCVGCHFDST